MSQQKVIFTITAKGDDLNIATDFEPAMASSLESFNKLSDVEQSIQIAMQTLVKAAYEALLKRGNQHD